MGQAGSLDSLLDGSSLDKYVAAGAVIFVGVSGGADSVALLHALNKVKAVRQIELRAVHIDHGLREESKVEASFVRTLCERLNIPLTSIQLSLTKKPAGTSPEAYWRECRYRHFKETMAEGGGDFLALGHNLDDLAETFIYHLTRGTGLAGLSFSFYKKAGLLPIIRPLWRTSRQDIEAVLRGMGESWMEDSSNAEGRYSRNLIRLQVLPTLRTLNPEVSQAIFRASRAISSLSIPSQDWEGKTQLSFKSLEGRSTGDISRILYEFVYHQTDMRPGEKQIFQARGMMDNHTTGTVAIGNGFTLVVTQSDFWIAALDQPNDEELAIAHCFKFGSTATDLKQALPLDKAGVRVQTLDGRTVEVTAAGADHGTVTFRNRGDLNITDRPRLKKAFIEFRIPWYLRDYLLLAEKDGTVFHVLGGDEKLNRWLGRRMGNVTNIEWTITQV